ncbi:deoxycytidylate deaminase [Phlebotomus argentipes]|uniref:deoxycytidylate deaminase n=1 Tax=Phlebotomus argentipes TaxID=94469 RepID=UPI002892D960|nr:deoxycytidylate deaminase [Phlebotomus argentipes]
MTTPTKRTVSTKRTDYIKWEEYFMGIAFLAAKRSKDPTCQVGACIVDTEKRIVGIGYNGFPNGCSDDDFPWSKDSQDPRENKFMYVCHAELNAILNKNSASIRGSTMYVALFPCNECAKVIIQSGIREVVFVSDRHRHRATNQASKDMLRAAGVKFRKFEPENKQIVIDFSEIDRKDYSQLPITPHKEHLREPILAKKSDAD